MAMFDELRLNAFLENCYTITIDTSLSSSKIITFRSYYAWGGINLIDWGDGTPPEKIGGYAAQPTHTYTTDGIYTIKIWSEETFFRWQANTGREMIIEFDAKNYKLDSPTTFEGCVNIKSIKLNGVSRNFLQGALNNTPKFNQDISSWIYWLPNNYEFCSLSSKNYLNYDYQNIDKILNACYDREINGDGWGGLVKNFNLGINCRRSTASDLSFNYLKNVRGWTITINSTVMP